VKIRIKYRHRPEFPGFVINPSEEAVARGPKYVKRELLEQLETHLRFYTQETEGAENGNTKNTTVRKLTNADREINFVEDDGETVIEPIHLTPRKVSVKN